MVWLVYALVCFVALLLLNRQWLKQDLQDLEETGQLIQSSLDTIWKERDALLCKLTQPSARYQLLEKELAEAQSELNSLKAKLRELAGVAVSDNFEDA